MFLTRLHATIASAVLIPFALLYGSCSDPAEMTDVGDAPVEEEEVPETDDDDDAVVEGPIRIAGSVKAVDRDTGLELSPEDYASRAGMIVVYLLENANDISQVVDKRTLTEPGTWEFTEVESEVPLYLSAVVDDGSLIIGAHSIQRHYAFNPLVAAGGAIEGIEIVIDLPGGWADASGPEPGGDGNGAIGDDDDDAGVGDDDDTVIADDDDSLADDDDSLASDDDDTVSSNDDDATEEEDLIPDPTIISGTASTDSLANSSIVVTTNSADMTEGPWGYVTLSEFGPFELSVANSRGATALLAYHDTDGNGLFEPSDTIGTATGNPFTLGEGHIGGASIPIPGDDGASAPTPATYVPVTGEVIFGGFNPAGDILVYASHATVDGPTYSGVTLQGPGRFALVTPPDASSVLVWAVFDANGDGAYDVSVDPFASHGPVEIIDGGTTGIVLDLGGGSASGTISGLVMYQGGVEPEDMLYIALSEDEPELGSEPAQSIVVSNPSFPVLYSFSDIESGTWWVTSYLDVGGNSPPADNPGGAPEDVVGGSPVILLSPGETDTSNNFTMGGV